MSRQAAAQSAKKEQKAAIAEKNAEKDRLAALGMTPALKRMIGVDVVLCMECGATQLGPTKCECKGGKKRPGPADEPIPHLIAAAKARDATVKAEERQDNAKNQSAVAKEREKRKEAKEDERNDMDAQLIGDDGVEMANVVEFPVGKLGMDIEANSVCKVGSGGGYEAGASPAADLGVKVGWVIWGINGKGPLPPKKAAIGKEIAAAMKAGPVKFTFRCPIVDGYFFCAMCDKFKDKDQYEEDQLEKGPGKQLCMGCADFADMGFD